jgi:pilus assembly protein CpaF
LHRSPRRFQDDDHVTRVVERMLLPLGRRIDEQSPMVDARLPDGSRVNVIIPPLAVDGPVITIRRFSQDPFTSEDLIRMGSLTVSVARLLEACVGTRLNILVSGGTGSGKTTFLNVLSSYIPADQRLVTIEDPAELQLRQPHVVRLETRPPNLVGKGAVTQRELLANALRMRPDRIIIGEVRSGEAFDMLQAMNTGHDGSLTTVHANTPRDALARVENMVLMAGMDLPQRAIREQISSALQIVVQLSRMPSGARRVTHVAEITGMESGTVTMQDLFVFRRGGGVDADGDGELVATGLPPNVSARLTAAGFALDPKMFEPPEDGEPSW